MRLPDIASPIFHIKTAAPKPKKPVEKIDDGDVQYLTDRNHGKTIKTPEGHFFFYLSALHDQNYNNGVYLESGIRGKRYNLKKESVPKFLSHAIFTLKDSGDSSKEYKDFISSLSKSIGAEGRGENPVVKYIKKITFEFIETEFLPKSIMSFYGDNAGIAFNDAIKNQNSLQIEVANIHLAIFKHNFKNLNKEFVQRFSRVLTLVTKRLSPWLDRILIDMIEELKLGVDALVNSQDNPQKKEPTDLEKSQKPNLPDLPQKMGNYLQSFASNGLVKGPSNSIFSVRDHRIYQILQLLVSSHIIQPETDNYKIVEGYLKGEVPIDKIEEVTGEFRVSIGESYPKLVQATINVKKLFASLSKASLKTHPYDTDIEGQMLPAIINWVDKKLKDHDKELQEIYNAQRVDPKSNAAQALVRYYIENKQAPFNTMPQIDESEIFYNDNGDLEIIVPISPDEREPLLDGVLTKAHGDYINLKSQ